MTKNENYTRGINSRLDEGDDQISDLEDNLVENT